MTTHKSVPNHKIRKKRGRKKWFFIGGGLILLILIIKGLMGGGGDNTTLVNTSKVEIGEIVSKVNATGRVKPKAEVNIQAEIYEIIVDLPVKEGDSVKAGDLLVKLKQISYQYAVDNARAALKTAQANYERAVSTKEYWQFKVNQTQELYDKGSSFEEQLISVKDQYVTAKTTVDSYAQEIKIAETNLNQNLDYYAKTEIVSPFDGVVTALYYEVGERTMIASPNVPGAIIMTVADLSVLEGEVSVDETDIKDVRIGQLAEINVDAFPDTIFQGVVTSVGASAQVSGGGLSEQVTDFLVKVQFLDKYEYIRPNLTAEVDIVTGSVSDVNYLPIQAIVALDELPDTTKTDGNDKAEKKNYKKKLYEGVFIIEGNKAKFVPVKLGIQDQANIQILNGLNGDETVISGPYEALRNMNDGDLVRAKTKAKAKE